MRFPKATREAIHAAGGKPVEIDWPVGGPEPQPNRIYTVQSSHRAGAFRVRVLFVDDAGERVVIRVDEDPVRLLGKSGGYVPLAAGAMGVRKPVDPVPMGGPQFRSEYEPEAISEVDMEALVEREATERRARITADIAGIEAAIEQAEENPDLAGALQFHRGLLLKLKARKLEMTPAEEVA